MIEAKGGDEALALMREHAGKIDLLITDVVMPQMDGPALVREMRELDPELKVIFISGYAEIRSASASAAAKASISCPNLSASSS